MEDAAGKDVYDFRSITEAFFLMEKELRLFERKVGGIEFWQLVRWSVHHQILEKKKLHGLLHHKAKRTFYDKIKTSLCMLKNSISKNPFFTSRCEILFIGHPRRKKMEDGLWWDIYCDPILEHLEKRYKCLLLEKCYPTAHRHFWPPKTQNLRYLDFPILLAEIFEKTGLFGLSLSEDEKKFLNWLSNEIGMRFSVRIDSLSMMVVNQLFFRKSILSIYKCLVKRLSPRLVLLVNSYGNKTFIEVCKKLSVPVAEIQHGTSPGYYHLGYSFPRKYHNDVIFPDYLMMFGDFWKNRTAYPISGDKIVSVGYPFFEAEYRKYRHIFKKNTILFISQGTIGRELSKFAVDLASYKNINMDVLYKLHPEEYIGWRERYPWLTNSRVKVVADHSTSLYRLLAEATCQIGVYSTVLYEGLGFGLRTFLVDLPGIEYMEELVQSELITVVSSADEVFDAIIAADENATIDPIYFFKPNSLKNISDAIEKII